MNSIEFTCGCGTKFIVSFTDETITLETKGPPFTILQVDKEPFKIYKQEEVKE